MSTAPCISVLLTSYNREQFIAESIESVLGQTHGDFELIVCDDRSQDGTAEIINGYARLDPRIRFFVNDRNLGQFENRRYAATLAAGVFLKYHDSDDVMYPHCLAAMVKPLEAEPRAAFALSSSGHWHGGRCPMLLTPQLAYEREYLGSGLFQLGPPSAMFRTQAFRDLGGFPLAGVASDYLFWLRACARVNVLLVSGDLFYYRRHAGQELVRPDASRQYAKSAAAAWEMLNSSECPLRGAAVEQAKRNFVFTQARGVFRHLRAHRFRPAGDILRYCGIGLGDWATYLRPPSRSAMAGTPVTE